ncbi:unnamed protein product, partial [Mesorhabditis belari]|uniref:Groucho/TLE N-terminal Q-rich domain-containing protein n=1 Tax=Mesorhabditis belari TaxID=2138241 RepID=A0AAF3J5E8_9BILA
MFSNRHATGGGGSGGGHGKGHGMGIMEHLDRIREEYNSVNTQLGQQRQELEKLSIEREQMQRQFMMYYEMSLSMNAEFMKQNEVNKKLSTVLQQVITLLPPDQATTASAAFERAKHVTQADLNQAMMGNSQAQAMALLQGQLGMQLPGNPLMNPAFANPAAFAALAQANSERANSARPRSASGKPEEREAKRTKIDPDEDEGGNIDVEVDEPSGSGQTNGHEKKPARADSGRESAHSVASSGASTPGIPKAPRNPFEAMLGVPTGGAGGRIPPNLAANPALLTSFDPHAQARLLAAAGMVPTNGKPPYSYSVEGTSGPRVTNFPADALTAPGTPNTLKKIDELPHGDVVCAVTVARDRERVFTGGKGCVKVWSLPSSSSSTPSSSTTRTPLHSLDCLRDNYIRSVRLLGDSSRLFVGGEASSIAVWDVQEQKLLCELDSEVQAVYALCLSSDEKRLFACGSDGKVFVWDTHNHQKIATLNGHSDGASCVDLSFDGLTLWTGGLDNSLRAWDIRELKESSKIEFAAQIFSLGCSPRDDWVAVGMESTIVEVVSPTQPEKYQLHMHESCVLSLKYAHSGNWFVSTGKDNAVNCWRSPYGANLVNYKETSSVLSCDISLDEQLLVTGSGEKKATVYEVGYTSTSAL